ncbi:hypothetical protein Pmani_015924 [Petrolisthes manimaculis]|uniref:SSD domain-containing protein n=1 Tax=Petrolisthes manimaculis TaxID=1843537 RepID=A0AAE1PSU5_9EUCA|nr:hypothetical protein Pmani_015924 [Petrolisthes manimaculis]
MVWQTVLWRGVRGSGLGEGDVTDGGGSGGIILSSDPGQVLESVLENVMESTKERLSSGKLEAFLAGSLVPVPALRCFCQQAALLVLVNLLAALTVFPALMTLDLRRRLARRPDLLCCLSPPTPTHQVLPLSPHPSSCAAEEGRVGGRHTPSGDPTRKATVTRALPPPGGGTVTQVVPPASPRECWLPPPPPPPPWSPWVLQPPHGTWCHPTGGVLAWRGCGLRVTRLPRSTTQILWLLQHGGRDSWWSGVSSSPTTPSPLPPSLARVPSIIKNDDGGLPEFWLSLFRDWLTGLQAAFDRDWRDGCFTQDKWHTNASDEGVLAYKLLVQTGHVDNPIDVSLLTQVRLVDSEGVINPKAFYNYLTAWVNTDSLAYSASQADLRPEPRHWSHDRYDVDLRIPKSSPLVYTQMPFYLHQLGTTEAITAMIQQVREICTKFYLVLALLAVLTAVFVVLAVVLMNVWASALVVLLLATLVLQLFGVLGILGIKLSAVPAVLLIVSVGVGVEFCVHVTVGFLTAVGGRDRRVIISLEHMATPVLHGAASTLIASLMLLFSEFDFIRRYFFYVLLALTVFGMLDGLVFLPVLLSLVGPPAEVVPRNHPDRLPTPSPPPSPQPHHHHHHHHHHSSSTGGSSRRGCVGVGRSGTSGGHGRSSSSGGSGGGSSSSSSRRCSSSGVVIGGSGVGGGSSSGGGGGGGGSSSMYPRLHHHHHHGGSNLSLTTITEEPSSSTRSSQSLRSSHEIVVEPQVVVETTTSSPPTTDTTTTESPHHHHHHHHVTTKVTATAKVKRQRGRHQSPPGAAMIQMKMCTSEVCECVECSATATSDGKEVKEVSPTTTVEQQRRRGQLAMYTFNQKSGVKGWDCRVLEGGL